MKCNSYIFTVEQVNLLEKLLQDEKQDNKDTIIDVILNKLKDKPKNTFDYNDIMA